MVASFRSELSHMLRHCRSNPEEVKEYCVNSPTLAPWYRQFLKNHWDTLFVLKLLEDWKDAGDCERIWTELSPTLECQPADLILLVILHRQLAKEVDSRLRRWPEIERKAISKSKRNTNDPHQIRQQGLAQILRADFLEARASLSREVDTAARMRFMTNLTQAFDERCGQKFVSAVAALTGIAFGETVTPDAVRSATRPRGRDARRNRGTRPLK
jgi:hypothetical protein